jgi:hypothetical protein
VHHDFRIVLPGGRRLTRTCRILDAGKHAVLEASATTGHKTLNMLKRYTPRQAEQLGNGMEMLLAPSSSNATLEMLLAAIPRMGTGIPPPPETVSAPVAQWIEHAPPKRGVVGSIPTRGTKDCSVH